MSAKRNKLLIIGADGFIGGNLLKTAGKAGWEVTGTSRKSSSGHVYFDLADGSLLAAMTAAQLRSYNAAVICAAISKINICCQEKDYCYKVNVTGTKRLIQELIAAEVKPVFLSSDQVFDGSQGYYNETEIPAPLNEYGRQKAEIEGYVCSLGEAALVLRLGLTVSDRIGEPHVFTEWYQKAMSGEPVYCIRNQVISPTFVDDVVKGITRAVEMNLSGLYNLCNPEYFTRYELAYQFFRTLGFSTEIRKVEQEHFGFPERRPIKNYLDGFRFRNKAGMEFTSMSTVFQRLKSSMNNNCFLEESEHAEK